MNPSDRLRDARAIVLVVAVTSGQTRPGPEDILLPNRRDNPRSTTGLDRPSWAIVRWAITVTDRNLLTEQLGYVTGATLKRILVAVERFLLEGGRPIATLPEDEGET